MKCPREAKPAQIHRFLIVDDNIGFRRVLEKILLRMGKVETARNGVEALERTQERPFDVIITDINMPLLGGIDFYQQAVEINPGLRKRFIICSGELTTAQNAFIEEQGLHLLTKPCSVNEILRMVADVLAETTP